MMLLWDMVRALFGSLARGLLAGIACWLVGELLINIHLMPSGAIELGIVGWTIASNVILAPRLHAIFDRMPTAGTPRREQRSAFFFQLFAAGAVALLLGLFFEALVFGLMQYFGVVSPYYCVLAFGLSFGTFWVMYLFTGMEPTTADAER